MNPPLAQGESSLRVVIAGGGPVGLTAANLLASAGVDVVLIERNPSTSDEAKAISMDAESLRVLHGLGLGARLDAVIAPGTGVRFYGRRQQRLFQARGARPYVFGYAIKSQFSQPELEQVLMRQLERRDHVTLHMSTEMVSYRQDADGVEVTLRGAGGVEDTVYADYLLGCDGGRSTVRKQAGITMAGKSFDDVWLVVDTVGDSHDDRCSMHFGDPDRPRVIVPGGDGRCRYEFLLRPGEGDAREQPPFDLIQRLLAPYRTITPDQVERAVNYRFSGLVAERWRDRRVFLLGDAAHMMPPFAGQGLNSGIRDAANLCWKLALIDGGYASPTLLDSYAAERKPHAEITVRASILQGRIVMTTNRAAARVRDAAVTAMLRIPWGRRYLVHLKYLPKPHFRSGLVVRDGSPADELVGSALDQPWTLHPDGATRRLDAVLGDRFNLLGVDVTDQEWERAIAALRPLPMRCVDVVLGDRRPRTGGSRPAIGDADGELEALLRPAAGKFVLLRPDRYVAAVFPSEHAGATAARLRAVLGTGRLLDTISAAKGKQ
ncbi:bifunctional 3-(3-hydroxy-phenyl)propionate/3-hydroxycinnamic acid hydroxylase [Nocardia sp. NPDC056000]|uniref:bifunctional 3-(3-hydroxy-phenyl)propionate/3-hydroxycinnamic acid hydroxylase n=1 Tax=Nocardia sp. NPDC056000 TaxID=3345674 RepID=UPI0035DD2440